MTNTTRTGFRTAPAADTPSSSELFPGDGEMGVLLCGIDWSQTALGPVDDWPQSLRTAINVCLSSTFPMCVWWGPQLIGFYNEAFRPIFGMNKTLAAVGAPAREAWAEVWEIVGPMIETVFAQERAAGAEDALFLLERSGYLEETYFTFSFSPIRGDGGEVEGIFCACTETTQRVIGKRRFKMLGELATFLGQAKTRQDACERAAEVLGRNWQDVPYSLFYLVDPSGEYADLVASTHVNVGSPMEERILLGEDAADCPFREALQQGKSAYLPELPPEISSRIHSPWGEPVRASLILQLRRLGEARPYGILVTGVSPRRELDLDYRSFLGQLADYLSSSIGSALAFQETQHRAKEALEREQEFNNHLRRIVESITDCYVSVDREFRYVDANARALDYLGKTWPELQGKTLWEVFPEAMGSPRAQQFEQAMKTGMPVVFLDPSVPRPGNTVEVNLRPHPEGLLMYFRDITEQLRSEQLRRRADAQYQNLVSVLPLALYTCNAEGRITYFNARAAELWGRKPKLNSSEELFTAAMKVFDIHGDRIYHEDTPMARAIKDGKRYRAKEVQFERPDGSRIVCAVNIQPLYDDEGKIIGAMNIFDEVTEKTRAEELISKSERYYRQIINLLPMAMYTCDANGHITFYNEAATQVWGLAPALDDPNLLYDAARNVYDSNGRLLLKEQTPMALALKTGKGVRQKELMIERADGARVAWSVNIEPILGEDGQVKGAIKVFEEITDKKQAEQALRESEQRHRQLMNLLPIGMYTCDVSGRITYFNEAATQVWGFEPNVNDPEVLFDAAHRVYDIHGNELQKEQTPMALALRTGKSYRQKELIIERADGAKVAWSVNIDPLRNAQGEVVGAIKVFEEVTDKKQAEQALREGERKYRQLVDVLPVAMYTCDAKGKINFYNQRAVQIWGRAPVSDTELNLDWFRAYQLDGTAIPIEDAPMSRALRTGETIRGEEVLVERADGTQAVLRVNIDPIRTATGELVGAINVFEDVTSSKLSEEALRRSEERFHSLADNIAQLAWMTDESGWIFWYNQPWFEYTGTTMREMEGWGWRKVHHPDHLDRVEKKFRWHIENEQDWEDTFPLRRWDGEYRWFLSSAKPIRDEHDKVVHWFGTNTDITEQLNVERQLAELNQTLEHRVGEQTREVQELANQLRALATELTRVEQRERRRLATILHDHIQQLLVAAQMQVEMLARGTDSPAHAARVASISGIIKEAITASRSLTVELSPPILHEAGLLGGLYWLASDMEQKHGFSVQVVEREPLEPLSEEVRVLLFESVRELLFNALKHSGVKKAKVIFTRSAHGRPMVAVQDRGSGFEPQRREAQLGSFGLFSIQQRLAHVGGGMEIKSEHGKGTRVIIVGPKETGTPPPQQRSSISQIIMRPDSDKQRKSEGERIRVLLVDDHKILREGLAGLLRGEPEVEIVGEADNGAQAIEMAQQLQPDVVVMDVNMPGMNGVEATRILREELPQIKVVGLSMHNEADVAHAMKEAGADGFVTKGAPAKDLMDAIRASLGQ